MDATLLRRTDVSTLFRRHVPAKYIYCSFHDLDTFQLTLAMKLSYKIIGVGRFRILGGQGLEFFCFGGGGGKGGPNSQQAHDVVTTSMQRNNVASTSF